MVYTLYLLYEVSLYRNSFRSFGCVRIEFPMSDDKDVKPWDLLNPNQLRSQEELVKYRLEICSACDFFKPATKQCSKCGCFMKLKTRLEKAHCPIKKW